MTSFLRAGQHGLVFAFGALDMHGLILNITCIWDANQTDIHSFVTAIILGG